MHNLSMAQQQTLYLDASPTTEAFRRAAFPSYAGRKFKLVVRDHPFTHFHSYWDGGSRTDYAVVELATMKAFAVPENGSAFVADLAGVEQASLPRPGFAVVAHSFFCGKDSGLTIYLHPENAAAFLPAPVELTWHEQVVLAATRSLKSSCGGDSQYRFSEARRMTGIGRTNWDAAKASLVSKGMLLGSGAITTNGKNAIGAKDLYSLRRTA
jgi:hypothetical protein